MANQATTTWLKAVSAVVIGFGVVVGLGALPATSGAASFLTDLAFWPVDGAQDISAPETRLLVAVGGGIMAAWGVVLWLLITRLFPREPALARTLILTSIGTWFVLDSIGSIVAGAPVNALFNTGFLLAFFVPLWRPGRNARNRKSRACPQVHP